MDGWVLCLRGGGGGGYDALRKQRSGFVPAFFFLGSPACLRLASILGVERVLFAVGKTDPILGRDKRLGTALTSSKSGYCYDRIIFKLS